MLSGIVIICLVIAAASTGALFKPGDWYLSLNKPGWTPPNLAFPIVWSVLYCLIAYSGILVWETGIVLLITLWGLQLFLNMFWSYLFFGLKRMKLALLNITMMLLCILSFITLALPVSKLAAMLFVPYAIWVTIAAALNFRIIQLN